MADDPFDLARFVAAQDPVMGEVRRELRAGRKRTHWMWFVFPQLRDLGRSDVALHYGIRSLAEARAYFAHPLLGPRLVACTALVNALRGRSVNAVFGSPDDLKFHSCMTLFDTARPREVFDVALTVHFGRERDARTLALLAAERG